MANQKIVVVSKKKYNFIKVPPPKFTFKRVLLILLGVAFIIIGLKFGVFDIIDEYNAVESELKEAKSQLSEIDMQLTDYDEVKITYDHYNYDYLTAVELERVDILEAFEIMEVYLFPYIQLTMCSVEDNVMYVDASDASMTTLTILTDELYESGYVTDVSIKSAASVEDSVDKIDGTKTVVTSITITLDPAGFEEQGSPLENYEKKQQEKIISGDDDDEEDDPYEENPVEAPEGIYTVDEVAWQVIRGKWGVGNVRWDLLDSRGYDSSEIQNRVDEFCAIYNITVNYENRGDEYQSESGTTTNSTSTTVTAATTTGNSSKVTTNTGTNNSASKTTTTTTNKTAETETTTAAEGGNR